MIFHKLKLPTICFPTLILKQMRVASTAILGSSKWIVVMNDDDDYDDDDHDELDSFGGRPINHLSMEESGEKKSENIHEEPPAIDRTPASFPP